jgi:hypothetical protein
MARRRPKDIGSLVVCALQNAIRWKQQCEPANATRASCGNRHQKGKRDRHQKGKHGSGEVRVIFPLGVLVLLGFHRYRQLRGAIR